MKMTKRLLVGITVSVLTAAAARTEPAEVKIGEWNEPTTMQVPGPSGPVDLVHRTREVEAHWPVGRVTRHPVDMLFEPESGMLWLGTAYEAYAIMGDAIYGAALPGSKLLLRKNKLQAKEGPEALIEQGMEQFLNELSVRGYKEDVMVSLGAVFGTMGTLYPRGAPMPSPIEIKGVTVTEEGTRVVMEATPPYEQENWEGWKRTMKLSLDKNMAPVAAELDGKEWPLMTQGIVKGPGRKLSNAWTGQQEWKILSEHGKLDAIRMHADLRVKTSGGRETRSGAPLLVPTKELLWFGPKSGTRTFLVGESLLAMWVLNDDLWVYDNTRSITVDDRLPNRVARLESEFLDAISSGATEEPGMRIRLFDFLTDEQRQKRTSVSLRFREAEFEEDGTAVVPVSFLDGRLTFHFAPPDGYLKKVRRNGELVEFDTGQE